MKNDLTLTDFFCEYLKVDCVEIELEAKERATKGLQNVSTKRRELCGKIPFLISPSPNDKRLTDLPLMDSSSN